MPYPLFEKNGNKGAKPLENVKQYQRFHRVTHLRIVKIGRDRGFDFSEDDCSKAVCGRRRLSIEGERFFMDLVGVDDPKHLEIAAYNDADEKKMIARTHED